LMCSLCTWGLQGVIVVQGYSFHINFPRDRLVWKLLVYLIILLECVQTVVVTIDAFTVFSSGWGIVADLDDLHMIWFTLPVMSSIIGLICHCLFAYRVHVLSGTWYASPIVLLLAAFGFSCGISFGVKLALAEKLSDAMATSNIYLLCGLWNGTAAVCDVVIAGFMSFYLSSNSTGISQTDVLITKIIRLVFETGALTG
ncbi:hypothetical protein FA15DRAFT_556219, partial [Coprinopsis marcescibilis]